MLPGLRGGGLSNVRLDNCRCVGMILKNRELGVKRNRERKKETSF